MPVGSLGSSQGLLDVPPCRLPILLGQVTSPFFPNKTVPKILLATIQNKWIKTDHKVQKFQGS